VTDLSNADLVRITWSGGPTHIASVATQHERTARGEVEYLAVRAPCGTPIAIGAIDYVVQPEVGTIWHLATMPEVQGLGIGTRLMRRPRTACAPRGLTSAKL
jgi:GNAT superfamily N-acetyltransferase